MEWLVSCSILLLCIQLCLVLLGSPVISDNIYRDPSFVSGTNNNEGCLSTGVAGGVAALLAILVVLPVGVVLGCCGRWCLVRFQVTGCRKKNVVPSAVYEEVQQPAQTVISLTENKAYGRVISQ